MCLQYSACFYSFLEFSLLSISSCGIFSIVVGGLFDYCTVIEGEMYIRRFISNLADQFSVLYISRHLDFLNVNEYIFPVLILFISSCPVLFCSDLLRPVYPALLDFTRATTVDDFLIFAKTKDKLH